MESSDVLKISVSNQDWVLIEKWRIKGGMPVQLNMPIARIRLKNGTTSQFLSPINGFLRRTFIKENEVVQIGQLLAEFELCHHPVVMKDMCAECGANLRERHGLPGDRLEAADAQVSMVHSIPELIVSTERAKELGRDDVASLLQRKKLALLVDLDQTLVNVTNVDVDPELPGVLHFQLPGDVDRRNGQPLWYHMRVRPGSARFLARVAQLFELHIVTFGTRLYAHTICAFLDDFVRDYRAAEQRAAAEAREASASSPDVEMQPVGGPDAHSAPKPHRPSRRVRSDNKGKAGAAAAGSLFSHRILSRDECIDAERKTPSLSALFPAEGALNLLCVIDDREQVWSGIANLVLVRPYIVPFVRAALDADAGDDYLEDLALFLERLHALFFELLERLNAPDAAAADAELLARTAHIEFCVAGRPLRVPDVRDLIARLRSQLLDGFSLVFSSVLPQPEPGERKHKSAAERSRSHRFARQLGARVLRDLPAAASPAGSAPAAASNTSPAAPPASHSPHAPQADEPSTSAPTDHEMADATQTQPIASPDNSNFSSVAVASSSHCLQRSSDPIVLIVTARYGTEKCRIGQRREPPVASVTLEWLFECFFRSRRLDPALFVPESTYDMAGLDAPEAYYARLYERRFLADSAAAAAAAASASSAQPPQPDEQTSNKSEETAGGPLVTIRSGAKPFPCLPEADAEAHASHTKKKQNKPRKHKARRSAGQPPAAAAAGDSKRLRLEDEKLLGTDSKEEKTESSQLQPLSEAALQRLHQMEEEIDRELESDEEAEAQKDKRSGERKHLSAAEMREMRQVEREVEREKSARAERRLRERIAHSGTSSSAGDESNSDSDSPPGASRHAHDADSEDDSDMETRQLSYDAALQSEGVPLGWRSGEFDKFCKRRQRRALAAKAESDESSEEDAAVRRVRLAEAEELGLALSSSSSDDEPEAERTLAMLRVMYPERDFDDEQRADPNAATDDALEELYDDMQCRLAQHEDVNLDDEEEP